MIIQKYFENGEAGEVDERQYFGLSLEENASSVDMFIEHNTNTNADIDWIRFQNKEDIRKIAQSVNKILLSNSEISVFENFRDIEAKAGASQEYLDAPENIENSIEVDKLTLEYSYDNSLFFLVFSKEKSHPIIRADLPETNQTKDQNNFQALVTFLRDFTQSKGLYDQQAEWEQQPKNLKKARQRLESAESLFYSNNLKGSAAQMREGFHALEKSQEKLENEIGEKKTKDIFRSINDIKDFSLHCEERDEQISKADVEFLNRSLRNSINYFASSLSEE